MTSKIKELRKEKGLTQIRIQIETNIDQSNYSKIERGLKEPSYSECKALAQILDTSMDYIAGLTNVKQPYPRAKK